MPSEFVLLLMIGSPLVPIGAPVSLASDLESTFEWRGKFPVNLHIFSGCVFRDGSYLSTCDGEMTS